MAHELEKGGADEGGAGDGHHPGEDDAASDAPADRSQAAGSANADNGAGDRVRGADRDTEMRRAPQRQRTGGLRRESAERRELGDALAHRFDDAPASRHRASTHGEVAANNNPVRDGIRFHEAAGDESGGDDAHALLCVVGAVAEAVGSGRKKLQAAEPAVNFQRALCSDDPACGYGHGRTDEEADHWRKEDEQYRFGPAMKNEGAKTGVRNGGAAVAAHECVRGTGGETED